jgi:hypothetical protein
MGLRLIAGTAEPVVTSPVCATSPTKVMVAKRREMIQRTTRSCIQGTSAGVAAYSWLDHS